MEPTPSGQASDLPLCVDLDGTLVNSDTLVELAAQLVRINPLYLFAMVFWLFSGKAHLKEQIASRTHLPVDTLPYNQPLLSWLREQCAAGRRLVLVTAANYRVAGAISAHLQLFQDVIASTATHNLGAHNKRDELVERYGRGGYDYIGNSRDDLSVWSACRNAVLVNTSGAVASRVAPLQAIEARFPRTHNPWLELLRAMRPHQWSKNLLVFVSIFVAQRYTDIPLLLSTMLAFAAFCLCSSAVYLVNDLIDLEADRAHSEKHERPFASGRAPVVVGIALAPLLLLAAGLLAWCAGSLFLVVLLFYFLVTLGYSLYFKRLVLMDVLVLAALYTLRIIAGATVAEAMPSVWLVSFSMFIFTSLAMAKRYAELKSMEGAPETRARGRGYHVTDLPVLAQMGSAAGYISVLVLALYIDSRDVTALYDKHHLMWLLCPLLLYWISRIWLLASRGELHQDPVIFATRDGVSYLVVALGILTILAAL